MSVNVDHSEAFPKEKEHSVLSPKKTIISRPF